ncbi:HesA/MoeB/ThiF family protein [Oceanomicrobium pacificus]|uniref:Molybdopterin-synthase adenylyltransferase n=1 Tax=Oceanomicrobium pacificus TaxID=2692916 RepID=A0A6B0TKS9_9RHOB|nr:molybdopterin-synthase adenylyltransferase MoeB [Oceanomicrobium pacificus]MXU64466.1 molybdopterin-synthase adenylyltransferase MoeB [Oceanomicrobium pacificus]
MGFTPEELERYARHIVLREVGGTGQQRLRDAHVLVIGAGGLGAPALLYLAAAGLGRLTLVDDDTVSLSNLQRQVLFRTGDIGRPKVEAAAEALAALNPHLTLRAVPERFGAETGKALFAGVDLVIDGSDNFATRHAVNAAAVAAGVPLLSGAMSQWEAQLSLYDPARGAPCYACIFPDVPADGLVPSCAEAGIIGALPGVIGAMMALEAIKAISGAGEDLRGTLLLYDALGASMRRISVARRADCAVCG